MKPVTPMIALALLAACGRNTSQATDQRMEAMANAAGPMNGDMAGNDAMSDMNAMDDMAESNAADMSEGAEAVTNGGDHSTDKPMEH